jgi:hypothetical protein
MLINGSANEREIEFETIRGFSKVADFHDYDGVTTTGLKDWKCWIQLLRRDILTTHATD